MRPIASDLTSALASAAIPFLGVSIGRPDDKGTWIIHFSDDATSAQRQAAASIIAAFDPNAPTIPVSVKMWQAKAALSASGKLEAANAVVSVANNESLRIAWEYATDVSRNSPGLNAVAAALSMTSAEVDALFIAADAIQV